MYEVLVMEYQFDVSGLFVIKVNGEDTISQQEGKCDREKLESLGIRKLTGFSFFHFFM